MQILTRAFLLILGLSFLANIGSSQKNPNDVRTPQQQQADALAKRDRHFEMLKQSPQLPAGSSRLSADQKKKLAEMEAEKLKVLKEINEISSVSREYHTKFAEFLKAKNTGIARIFPDKNCGKGITVSVDELERCNNTPQIKGAGSLYSVRLSEIPAYLPLDGILFYIGESDIHFIDDKFVVGNKTTQSIISEIGDVSLDDIDAKSTPIKFLTEFEPSKNKSEMARQKQELDGGINSNGYLYSTSAPIKLNSAYALRSIAFQQGKYTTFWNTDLLIAFKVVGQEDHGSVVILWKKLKQREAPLLRNK